jgi:hypothetical protein
VRSIFVDGVLESLPSTFSVPDLESRSRSMEVMEVEDLVLVPLNPGRRWEKANVGWMSVISQIFHSLFLLSLPVASSKTSDCDIQTS